MSYAIEWKLATLAETGQVIFSRLRGAAPHPVHHPRTARALRPTAAPALPENWPWAHAFTTAMAAITAIPARC